MMRQLKIIRSITNREADSLDRYLNEISREGLITAEEEVDLTRKIKAGDQLAFDKLVRANLRFVISVAKQYQNQGLVLPDLVNEGNVGLIKAAQRFDETRGFKFISYAVWWIRQAIMQAISEQSRIVRLPLNKVGALSKINKTFAKMEQVYQREPTVDEIADMMGGMSPEEVTEALLSNSRHSSIDAPLFPNNEESTSNLADTLANKDEKSIPFRDLMLDSAKEDINRALAQLSPREQQVLESFFGLNGQYPRTLDEIGGRIDLTRERVRQLKEKALRILRNRPAIKKILRKHLTL